MSFVSYQPDNIVFVPNKSETPKDLNLTDCIVVENGAVVINDDYKKMGVYDTNGLLCPESILLRGEQNMPPKVHANISNAPLIDEEVLFLGSGYLMIHFGHFLVEGISRTWPLLYSKYKNIKVVIAYETKQKVPVFVRKFLNALGVPDENIIAVYKTTRFKRVIIPRQAINGHLYMLPIMNKVFNKLALNLVDKKYKTYNKIYLSRSAMNDGRTFGEKQVEKIFEKNGYKIIYPETLPLEHQVALAANCKEMAGTAGSALHLALFMKAGGRVVQIKRNSTNADNIVTQKLICDLRKLDLIWIYGSIETVPTGHFTMEPQIIGVTPYLIKFFDDNHFKYSKSDLDIDSKEFDRYKQQLKKYKIKKTYKKIIDIPVRLISVFGITKHNRKVIREYLRKKLYV